MNEQGIRFRIGVFVLTAMILLAVLIILFGRFPTILKPASKRYYVVFNYAPGVAVNTPVRRSGVRIGQVENVELDDESGRVRVTILIESPHVLYTDDEPKLIHGALSGDTSIDLGSPAVTEENAKPPKEGKAKDGGEIKRVSFLLAQQPAGKAAPVNQPPAQRKAAAPGTVFQGQSEADIATLLSGFKDLTPSAQATFIQMQRVLKEIEKMTPLMRDTMSDIKALAKSTNDSIPDISAAARQWTRVGEEANLLLHGEVRDTLKNINNVAARASTVLSPENERSFSNLLKNASNSSNNLESIAKNTDTLLKDGQKTMQRFGNSITEADKVLSNLQVATKPIAERSDSVMRNLDESTVRLNRTLTELNDLLRSVNQGEGALRHFINDPALYNNLNEAASMLTHTLPRVDRILRDFEVFADKIARHPESLGVGGAIKPSAGLKDTPNTSHWRGPNH